MSPGDKLQMVHVIGALLLALASCTGALTVNFKSFGFGVITALLVFLGVWCALAIEPQRCLVPLPSISNNNGVVHVG